MLHISNTYHYIPLITVICCMSCYGSFLPILFAKVKHHLYNVSSVFFLVDTAWQFSVVHSRAESRFEIELLVQRFQVLE